MATVKILVIDDDAVNQDVVKAMLGNMQYESIPATDGSSGLKLLAETEDLKAVLLDWQMPEMNGIEVLKKIRSSKFKNIPVVMLTGEDKAEKVKEALEAGADNYIVKPFDEKTLSSKLRQALTGTSFRRDKKSA